MNIQVDSGFDGAKMHELYEKMLSRFGLDRSAPFSMSSVFPLTPAGDNDPSCVVDAVSKDPAPFSIVVVASCRASHVVGLFKLGGGRMLFFDPNLGEFFFPNILSAENFLNRVITTVYIPLKFDRGYSEHYWGRPATP